MRTDGESGWSSWLAGAAEGTAATLVMSGVMLAARRAGRMGELPPRRITAVALRRGRAGRRARRRTDALATVAHLGFGAAAGAAFEGGWSLAGRRGPAPLWGAAFGAAVWLVSYAGWIPALRILPPPHRDRPGRPLWMFVAHLVYGAALGALAERRRPPDASRRGAASQRFASRTSAAAE
jgi:hypothetical protein